MKIAIDIQTTLGQKVGMGIYVANLIDRLPKIDSPPAGGNEYLFFAPKTNKDLSVPKRFFWDQFGFPKQAKKEKVDILHQPCFSAPMFYNGKIVVTAHDIITMLFPSKMARASNFFFSRFMPWSYRFADLIIADSNHTKNDIVKHLKIKADKIHVVHLAANSNFKPIEKNNLEKVKNKYQLNFPYILHVGTLEPRKNLNFLIRAYHLAKEKYKIPHKLVITGKKGWHYQELFSEVERLNLENEVIFTGYIPDEEMPAIYNLADLFAFPSFYEGFGLPPLEAMSCGAPVVSSNTSSLPEVVGDAGVLLPPKGEKLWAEKMAEVLNNGKLRITMGNKGVEQAKKFSWDKCAKETIEVYKKAMEL